jgi:hypothetical protein
LKIPNSIACLTDLQFAAAWPRTGVLVKAEAFFSRAALDRRGAGGSRLAKFHPTGALPWT